MTNVLNDLIKSLDGFLVMTVELENLFENLSRGKVPVDWQKVKKKQLFF